MYAFNSELPRNLAKLQRLINTGTDLVNTYLFSGGHAFFTVSNKVQTLKRLLEEEEEQAFLKTFQSLSQRETQGLEFLKLYKKLREEHFWEALSESLPSAAIRKLNRMKAQWQHQASLAHCTTDAIFALESILVELDSLIAMAEKKLKKPPTGVSLEYANHLAQLKQEIQQKLEILAEVLFYRSKIIFNHHNLTEPNSLKTLLIELQNIGLDSINEKGISTLLTNELIAGEAEEETVFPLAKSFALIDRQGNRGLKEMARNYLSLMPKKAFALEPMLHGDTAFFVPESLKAYIPQKPRILMRLFPGYKFRYQFFHDKAPLLFQLAALNHNPPSAPWNLQNPGWQIMVSLQETLETELQAIASQKRGWFSWFWNTTLQFLTGWQQIVKEQQRLITQKQLHFLSQMAQEPMSLNEVLQENAPLQSEKFSLTNALTQFEKNLTQTNLVFDERHLFYDIKLRLEKRASYFAAKKGYLVSTQLMLETLNQSAPLNDEDFTMLKTELVLQGDNLACMPLLEAPLTKISNHLENQLTALANTLETKDTVDKKEEELVKQSAQVLSFFTNTPKLQNNPSFYGLQQSFFNLTLNYQEYLNFQPAKLIAEQDSSLRSFEQTMEEVGTIDEEWRRERAQLEAARKIRTTRISEYQNERIEEITEKQVKNQKILEEVDSVIEAHHQHLETCRNTRTRIEQEYLQRQEALQLLLSRHHPLHGLASPTPETEWVASTNTKP